MIKLIFKVAIFVFIAGASFAIFRFVKESNTERYEFFTATKGSIVQEVTLTGKTQSTESVDLSFETSGKVKSIDVEIGDTVEAGQILVSLNSSEASLELAEAQAQLEVELSALRELKKGTRPEEILVYETKLSNAKVDSSSSLSSLADKLRDSFTKADDSIRNNIDQLFSNPRTTNPQFNINVSDSQLKNNIEQGRVAVEETLASLRDISGGVSSENATELLAKSDEVVDLLNAIKSFLDKVALAVNALSSSSSLNQATVDAYKTAVSTARSTINSSVSSILTSEETARASISAVSLAETELALKKAGATSDQISSQDAKVRQSQAKIARLKLAIDKMVLRSPISGVVTKQDAKVGGVVSAQAIVVSIIVKDSLEIEANIPEVDIGRVALGNQVNITVDAFPGENFDGVLSYIDPAETVVDGVVNFKSKVTFKINDTRLKSGLTANLEIQSARKDNIILVPQLAILENDSGAFVKVLKEGKLIDVKVVLGARDNFGNVEVVSGVREGDMLANVGLKTN